MTKVVVIDPSGGVSIQSVELTNAREFRRLELVSPTEMREIIYKCIYQKGDTVVMVEDTSK